MNKAPRYTQNDLNLETARIAWPELERHFARGVVVQVLDTLDLVEVATAFANDDKATVEGWLTTGEVRRLEIEIARDWRHRDPDLWAVVTAPWVLVQERRPS